MMITDSTNPEDNVIPSEFHMNDTDPNFEPDPENMKKYLGKLSSAAATHPEINTLQVVEDRNADDPQTREDPPIRRAWVSQDNIGGSRLRLPSFRKSSMLKVENLEEHFNISPSEGEAEPIRFKRKMVYLSVFLFLAGIVGIFMSFIAFEGSDNVLGGCLLTVGVICAIPGVYYTYLILKATFFTNSVEERNRILSSLPMMIDST